MYGTGIGTGTAGTAMAAGLATGNVLLVVAMAFALGYMAYVIVRNHRRQGAHQRP